MEKVKRIFYRCAGGVGVISAVGYLAIIAICIFDVLLEKTISRPITGSYELVERCMVVAVFASFAYAQAKKAHINMMILIERFPRFSRLITLGLASLLSVGITGYAAYAAYTQTGTAMRMGTMTAVLHIPLWPFFMLQAIALFFLAVILLLDTIYVFAAVKSDSMNEIVTDEYGMLLPEPKPESGSE